MVHNFYILQHILDKFKDQNDFMLVEYSFGLLIAIKLTRKLETKRFIGQLILVGGTPRHLKMLIQQ